MAQSTLLQNQVLFTQFERKKRKKRNSKVSTANSPFIKLSLLLLATCWISINSKNNDNVCLSADSQPAWRSHSRDPINSTVNPSSSSLATPVPVCVFTCASEGVRQTEIRRKGASQSEGVIKNQHSAHGRPPRDLLNTCTNR